LAFFSISSHNWFDIGIEVLQELSNHISTKKIHGNFDPVDVFYNVMGLIVATLFWGVSLMVKKIIYHPNNIKNENKY